MSSATKAATSTILARIEANWTATPVAWPGASFSPPASGAWIRPTILWGDGFEDTLGLTGDGKNRVAGLLRIQIFDVPTAGPGLALGYADTLRDLFNRVVVSGVRFGAPTAPRASDTDGRHQMHILDCPFEVEETI